MKTEHIIGVAAIAALLSGCSVTGPTQFLAEGAGIPGNARVSLERPAEGNAQDTQLAAALEQALTARGFTVADDAQYLIRYSVAERPAGMGLARENAEGSVDTISYARSGLLLDRCVAQRMRVNVVAYELATGAAAYRGTAEFNDCRFDSAPFDKLAEEIAQRAAAE